MKMRTIILAILASAQFFTTNARADTVTTSDVVNYVQNTWGIATDGSDAITYFSGALGQQYNGIPYSDYITMLVVSSRIGTQLDNQDYSGAAYSLANYSSGQVVNAALENVGADGLFGVASFASDEIQFGLDLFVQTVAQKTFNEQCKFYFIARSQYNLTPTEILNRASCHQGDQSDVGAVFYDDSGWIHSLPFLGLDSVAGTPLFFVNPSDFYAVAEQLYQAKLARDGNLAYDSQTVREAFRQVIQPSGPVITTDLADQTITDTQTATFSVTATGAGTLTYAWYQNGVLVPSATGSSFNATVAGLYQVIVTDGNGQSAHSRIATLTVNPSSGSLVITAPATGADCERHLYHPRQRHRSHKG